MADEGSWDRRRFLTAMGTVAGLAAAAQLPTAGVGLAAPRERGANPFGLGVASGDPRPDGVVLWTRIAPDPLAPGAGGGPRRPLAVQWQVARDEAMREVVQEGTAAALPELGRSVHVEPAGLRPDTEYFYRFRHDGETSPVGRTRTAPAVGSRLDRLAFAFASCQDWAGGYYSAYRHMAEEDLALVVHLGDYVYEGGIPADGGNRRTPLPAHLRGAPRTLADWRLRYALYRSDPDLQRVHARFPFVVTWDDHEVLNDYAGTQAEGEPDITTRRIAAYQAYYENLPLRAASIPTRDGLRLYRRLSYGDLASFSVLDGRQYRDAPPCAWGEGDACPAQYDPAVSMLGAEQERWLLDGLGSSSARWDVLANNVMMGRLDHDGPAGSRLWHDAWDGFPAARNRITDRWVQAGVRNPVVVTGDWHSTFVHDIHQDFDRPDSPVVATEFVGTSITTNGDEPVYGPYYGPMSRSTRTSASSTATAAATSAARSTAAGGAPTCGWSRPSDGPTRRCTTSRRSSWRTGGRGRSGSEIRTASSPPGWRSSWGGGSTTPAGPRMGPGRVRRRDDAIALPRFEAGNRRCRVMGGSRERRTRT